MEDGGWRMEDGGWRGEDRISRKGNRAFEQSMGRGLETRYDVLIAAQTGRFRYNILKVVPLIVLVAQLFVILHV